jgi:hypothetical protein
MLDIFDNLGRVSTDAIDPATVEALPDNQRKALFECISACRARTVSR